MEIMKRSYSKEAAQFIAAIQTISNKPENLENLESYLSIHFEEWLEKWASKPDLMALEMSEFANMEI